MIVANCSFWFGGKYTEKGGKKFCLLFNVLFCLLFYPQITSGLNDWLYDELKSERAEAANEWAPLVYLHPKETIFPIAVHSFLKNVVPKTVKEAPGATESPVLVPISRSLNTNLPEGLTSKDSYLIADIDPACGNCALPDFLYGTKPSPNYAPPVYAVISSCLPPKGKKPIERSSQYGPGAQGRRRFGKRIKDSIIRAGNHIRSRYLARRGKNQYQRRNSLESSRENKLKDSSESKLKEYRLTDDFSSDELKYTTIADTFTEATLHSTSKKLSKSNEIISRNDEPKTIDQLPYYSDTNNLIENDFEDIESTQLLPLNHSVAKVSSIPKANVSPRPTIDETTSTYSSIPTSSATSTATALSSPLSLPSSHSHKSTQSPFQTGRKRDFETHPHWKNKKPKKGHHFTITYWMFYPFSRGKPICTSNLWLLGRVFKPRIRNKCYGDEVMVNDHVGDWEHISIFFEDGMPERMYISSHYFGSYYKYNYKRNTFDYVGKDTRNPLPLSATFPPIVKIKGTHPVVFSALGSHGMWGGPGKHKYLNFIKLTDETESGTPWKTWKNIDIIDYRDSYLERPDRQWLKFHGRWGNPSYGCHKGLFGICYLSKGPTGIPEKRENFPCHKPDHPTFKPKP